MDSGCVGRPLPKPPLDELVEAAIAWWRDKKPIAWSDAEHLRNPEINLTGLETEKRLARAIAIAIMEADARWKV